MKALKSTLLTFSFTKWAVFD